MDVLLQEIAKKKKSIQSLQTTGSTSYIRQKDIQEKARQAYLEKEAQREKSKPTPLSITSHQDEDASPDTSPLLNIPVDEVLRRLRAHNQPICYFGETDSDRLKRLHVLEAAKTDEMHGQRNEFKLLLESTGREKALEILTKRDREHDDEEGSRKKEKVEPVDTSEFDKMTVELYHSHPEIVRRLVVLYLQYLLSVWAQVLDTNPSTTLDQTKQRQAALHLKAFFKILKKNQLDAEVLEKIVQICENLWKREYVIAHDAYLRLSIGNAPWPIGVTMVGIHERSAREKISSSQVGHVLNDETQRKWIQAIKRIMTFTQAQWPPEDVSKIVG